MLFLYDATGKLIKNVGRSGSQNGSFAGPRGVAVGGLKVAQVDFLLAYAIRQLAQREAAILGGLRDERRETFAEPIAQMPDQDIRVGNVVFVGAVQPHQA